jgi:hypothetical protein
VVVQLAKPEATDCDTQPEIVVPPTSKFTVPVALDGTAAMIVMGVLRF